MRILSSHIGAHLIHRLEMAHKDITASYNVSLPSLLLLFLQLSPAHTSHHLCLMVQSLLLATSDGGNNYSN